jgi:hypothetical protein
MALKNQVLKLLYPNGLIIYTASEENSLCVCKTTPRRGHLFKFIVTLLKIVTRGMLAVHAILSAYNKARSIVITLASSNIIYILC